MTRRILLLAMLLLMGGASSAFAQTLSFGPGQTAILVNSIAGIPVDVQGNDLRVSLSSPAVGNIFVPIGSSNPSVVLVDGGGVTIPEGQSAASVVVTALQLGSSTLTAEFGPTQVQATVQVVTSLPVPTVPGASIWLLLPGLLAAGALAIRGRAATP